MVQMCKRSYSFIDLLIGQVISYYQLNSCFFIPFEIWMEHTEHKHCIKAQITPIQIASAVRFKLPILYIFLNNTIHLPSMRKH